MPRPFNVIRASIFFAALVFAIIVFGVAAFLSSILVPSSLTRFVDIALFVSILTILCTTTILFFGARERDRFITHTRWEVILTGIMGLLWLILALILSLQPVPDVDCPNDSNGHPSDYTTEDFHAQYHVIQAFAVLELILLCGWAIFLFTLAMRHHLAGRKQVWNARVNEAPWFRSRTPKASPDDKFTRLPAPISSRSKHRRRFSSPVGFFTRKNTDAEKKALRQNDSGSSRSVSTDELAAPVVAPAFAANRGTGFLHTRTRSEPVPAMFGAAATRAAAMPPRPPLSKPPAAAPSSYQPAWRPSESRAAPGPAAAATYRSRGLPTNTNKPVPPTPVMSRNVPNSKTPIGRSNSNSRGGPPPRPSLDRRPTTTSPPIVYVPTPASTHAWQRSPLASSEAVRTAALPPIASRMMQERPAGANKGRSGNTSRDRGPGTR